MPRPLGPALLSLAVAGCYHGLDEADITPTESSTTTADTHEDPTNGTGDDAAPGTDHVPGTTDISLSIVDRDGQPIAGVQVHHDVPDAPLGDRTLSDGHIHLTDATGHLVLTGYRGARAVILVDGEGWSPATAVVDLVPDRSIEARVTLLRRDRSDPNTFKNFSAEHGVTNLDFGAVQVTIPANALVDPTTDPPTKVTGPVAVSVVPIDPTTDLIASPGPLLGFDANEQVVPLRSLFMAEISVWQGDRELELDDSVLYNATIRYRIPPALAAKYTDGTPIPAWYYDLDAGLWIEELDAGNSKIEDGFWTATVPHFTHWNADVPIDQMGCVNVTTCVGNPCKGLPFTPVTAQGDDFLVTELTDETGVACLNIPENTPGQIWVTLPNNMQSEPKPIPMTENAMCGPPEDCASVEFKFDGPFCPMGFEQECTYEGPQILLEAHGMCKPPVRKCVDDLYYGLCTGGYLAPPNVYNDGCLPDDVLNDPENPNNISEHDRDCDGLLEPAPGCLCTIDHPYPCYDYPSEYHLHNEDVCGTGLIDCMMGQNAPQCMGSVDPGPLNEDPNTLNTDDDCDGSLDTIDAPAPTIKIYDGGPDGGWWNQVVWDVVADADHVYITGSFETQIDLGGCILTSNNADNTDMFVARLSAIDLSCQVARHIVAANKPDDPLKIARDPVTGNVAVLGSCGEDSSRVLDLNNNPNNDYMLTGCLADPQALVVFFDTDLTVLTHKVLGRDADGMSPDFVDARALTYSLQSARFLIAGGFSLLSHNNLPQASTGAEDLFIAEYDAAGNPGDFTRIPGLEDDSEVLVTAIAAHPVTGDIVLAGTFYKDLQFAPDPAMTGIGAYVARFKQDKTLLKSRRLADTAHLDPTAVAIASDGTVYVAGNFDATTTIKNNEVPVVTLIHTGNGDAFLLPLGADLTLHQPVVHHGADTPQKIRRLALNSYDEPHTAGSFESFLRVTTKQVISAGASDTFVVKFTPLDPHPNDPLWVWTHGTAGDDDAYGLAIHGTTAYVVGRTDGPGDAADGFVTKLAL